MITQADIRTCWDQIKPGLEDMCSRWKTGWRPEDVYADCKHGTAWLYEGVEDRCFMVVRELTNYHTSEKSLLVWVAYAFEGNDIVSKYLPDVEQLAKEYGYKKIVFESPRRGWLRKEGWKEGMTVYEREVA